MNHHFKQKLLLPLCRRNYPWLHIPASGTEPKWTDDAPRWAGAKPTDKPELANRNAKRTGRQANEPEQFHFADRKKHKHRDHRERADAGN